MVLFSCAAIADDANVHIGETGYLRSANGDNVIVFKSQDAMSKAVQLSKAGADSQLLVQYVACLVPTGTKILVITGEISSAFWSGAEGTSDVMVITGPYAGCKGVVNKKYVQQ